MKERTLGLGGVSGCEWWVEQGCRRAGGEVDSFILVVPARPWQFAAEPVSSAYCGGGSGPDMVGKAAWKAMGTPWFGGSPGWRVW